MSAAPEIGFADAAAIPEVARLLRAMDAFYRPGEALPDDATYLATVRRTMETREGTRFVLARAGGAAVGLACIAVLRPGRNLAGLVFLKDLFVDESARDRGVGRALMGFLARFAVEHGIGRIDLTTGRDNAGARRLYAALGGEEQDKVFFSFPAERLRRMADDAGA